MDMGPPHPPVESWNPPLVKILFHDMKNWSNDGKKSIFAILAMSQRVADILELVQDWPVGDSGEETSIDLVFIFCHL